MVVQCYAASHLLPHGPVRQAIDAEFRGLAEERRSSLFSELRQLSDRTVAPDLRLPVPTLDLANAEEAKSVRRLVFAERLVPRLIGRDQELQELRAFRDSAFEPGGPKVSWWLWYGEGGVGKSRLALDFLYESLDRWQAGFLHKGFPERIADWQPEHPTLIVIDYAATYAENCREAISSLAAKKDRLRHPVRFLLLERYYTPSVSWARDLWTRSDDPSGILMHQCAWRKSGEPRPERLGPLRRLDDFLELFELAVENLTGRRPSAHEVEGAAAFFDTPEFKQRRWRPLYAGLSALVAAEKGFNFVADWRTEDLEDYVLAHEENLWRTHIRATQCDVNMLFLSTLLGEITPAEFNQIAGEKPPCIQAPAAQRLRDISSHSANETQNYMGLQPDLVGEAFVSARLKGDYFTDENSDGSQVRLCSRELFDWALKRGKSQ
jgi:hypothetical protein